MLIETSITNVTNTKKVPPSLYSTIISSEESSATVEYETFKGSSNLFKSFQHHFILFEMNGCPGSGIRHRHSTALLIAPILGLRHPRLHNTCSEANQLSQRK